MKRRGKGGRTQEERLAARYWYYLDFYPRWFRDSRGDELVGTLLDCARPGQVRPSGREVRALVREGLRVRAGTGGHRPARATVALGVQFGLLILLVTMTIGGLSDLATQRGYDDVRPATPGWWALVGLAALAGVVPFVLVARGRVRPAVPFVMLAGAVSTVGFPWLLHTRWPYRFPLPAEIHGVLPLDVYPSVPVVAVAAVALLVWLRPPVVGPATVTLAVVVPTLFYVPGWLEDARVLPADFSSYVPAAPFLGLVLYVGVIWYATVDARPAVAMLVQLAVIPAEMVVGWLKMGEFRLELVPVILVPVGIAAWFGTRRQAAVVARV